MNNQHRNNHRVFLISPARIGGPRSNTLLRQEADFDLAIRLRNGSATLGEAYSFISGLYFRGKMAYVGAFAAPPVGAPPALIIVPGLGLVPPQTMFHAEQLRGTAGVPIKESNPAFTAPLLRDAAMLDRQGGPDCQYVLLGSIATAKYTDPLLQVFGERLLFPSEFVGRGDMSRGGLVLRCAQSGNELSYVCVRGATVQGRRPEKLSPLRKR
ncbi:MAG: hypothetical protein LAP61_26635 [Acidobacteriia bacterium]|nr:hypothetical protein [Terriglobia bacterium]